ncbi:MAG TPA: DUF2189 domain-containing protein [Steroidobacteraceae bacterium]|jgi:uncharacterized membrane protein|nr:DUF2189 domain-containing protein [Steroidobacteraceae bacterium]
MGTTLVARDDRAFHVDVQHASLLKPFVWIGRGWLDMRRHWGASLGYGALIVAIGWTLLVFCATHPYFVAAAITGFLLVGPAVSAGLCEMSRRYSAGQSANFDESLEGFKRNVQGLSEFGLILAICAAIWFALSAVLLDSVFHIPAPSVSETLYRGFVDTANRSQVISYVAVGGLLAAGVFAVSVVSIPLLIDRHATAGQAMRASVRVAIANIPAMIVWSALITLLTIIGYAPLLAGLLIIAPLLGHATWHAYRDLVR